MESNKIICCARMAKLAELNNKKLVKHHSLNNLNMEAKFRRDLLLFKTVLKDQLIGYCDAPGHLAFISHFHQKHHYHPPESVRDRLRLCSSYAELLVDLHDHGIELNFGDFEDFLETVIVTPDPYWRLILDDVQLMDAGPSRTNSSSDIWMAPEVCNSFLLSNKADDKQAKIYLTDIHKQCRQKEPEKRPSAHQLAKAYREVIHKYEKLQLFNK